jgi:5-formyltetrahydrofolate cyclo-ligase
MADPTDGRGAREVHEVVGEDERTQRDELRRQLRRQRAALADDAVRAASAGVCAELAAWPPFVRAHRVALYASTRGEIDPSSLARLLYARGATVAYPRVASVDPPQLSFLRVDDPAALAAGQFGIPEPPGDAAAVADLDLVFVPGVAFARDGHRLGFGRGYYDRALAAHPRALRIGLCYEFQLLDRLPPRDGDEPVDVILTPRERLLTRARPLAPEEVLP